MKTTLDIADTLFDEAKRIAARDGETLRSLVEQGLRKVLAERGTTARPFKLKQVTYGSGGYTPEFQDATFAEVLAASCGDRGG